MQSKTSLKQEALQEWETILKYHQLYLNQPAPTCTFSHRKTTIDIEAIICLFLEKVIQAEA